MSADALVILGCGWIARRHATAARRIGWPTIFASRDAARATSYCRAYRGVAACGSYADALRHPRALAALICTPHDRHLDDARAALASGVHILVEKPIAPTLEDADRMIDTAHRAGRVLMVAENFHFMPAFRHVRSLLERGVLGALREIHLVGRGFRRHGGWRADIARMGGGALIDGGIHYVHLLRWWGDGVTRVYALRPPQTFDDYGGEDAVNVITRLASGAVGVLTNSLAAPGWPQLQCSALTGANATCFADNRGRFLLVRGGSGLRLRVFRRDVRGHEAMLRAFAEAIRDGVVPESDGASGRADLEVVLAAYRSIAAGGPIDLRS